MYRKPSKERKEMSTPCTEIERLHRMESKLDDISDRLGQMRGFVAGVVFVITAVGAVLGAAFSSFIGKKI